MPLMMSKKQLFIASTVTLGSKSVTMMRNGSLSLTAMLKANHGSLSVRLMMRCFLIRCYTPKIQHLVLMDFHTLPGAYLRKRFEFGTETADSLTVLHNRTNMVRVFGNSVTVKNSGGETRTRCVTSCAGSTAFLSVVAQTRRGFRFLSGGSARQTANVNEVERTIQLEKAYARATVALTRARRLCVLLCPLDQKGPIGAARNTGGSTWKPQSWSQRKALNASSLGEIIAT